MVVAISLRSKVKAYLGLREDKVDLGTLITT